MADDDHPESLRGRLSRQGEEALGKLAEELVGNPLVNATVARALEARERAVAAQEAALGAMNIPSAADIERLTRRLRSVSQRLEGIEDSVDRLDERLGPVAELSSRIGAVEESMAAVEKSIDSIDRGMKSAARKEPKQTGLEKAVERLGKRIAKLEDSREQKALAKGVDQTARDVAALRAALVPKPAGTPRAARRSSAAKKT